MTHSNVTRDVESFGSLKAEVLELDISALDRAGEEDNVAPTHLNRVRGSSVHFATGSNQNGEYVGSYNETRGGLAVHNVSSGSAAPNNAALNTTRVTWWGER